MSFQYIFNCVRGNIQTLDIRDELFKSSRVFAVAWLPHHLIDQICQQVRRKFSHLDKLTNSVMGNSRRYSRLVEADRDHPLPCNMGDSRQCHETAANNNEITKAMGAPGK